MFWGVPQGVCFKKHRQQQDYNWTLNNVWKIMTKQIISNDNPPLDNNQMLRMNWTVAVCIKTSKLIFSTSYTEFFLTA